MTGVLLTPELAKVVQEMVREYLRTNPDLIRGRQSAIPRMHDYAIRMGKVDAGVEAGESVDVSIYGGTTKGSETDTGDNVNAYLRYSSLTSGAWCHVAFIDGGWEILVGDPCWEP